MLRRPPRRHRRNPVVQGERGPYLRPYYSCISWTSSHTFSLFSFVAGGRLRRAPDSHGRSVRPPPPSFPRRAEPRRPLHHCHRGRPPESQEPPRPSPPPSSSNRRCHLLPLVCYYHPTSFIRSVACHHDEINTEPSQPAIIRCLVFFSCT